LFGGLFLQGDRRDPGLHPYRRAEPDRPRPGRLQGQLRDNGGPPHVLTPTGKLHLSFEELSALFDGELSAQADTSARQHLRECPQCSAEYSLSVRLERDLRQPPVLSCDSALELLSASFDDQASQPERAVADRHL